MFFIIEALYLARLLVGVEGLRVKWDQPTPDYFLGRPSNPGPPKTTLLSNHVSPTQLRF